jgi:hypothetical protein
LARGGESRRCPSLAPSTRTSWPATW